MATAVIENPATGFDESLALLEAYQARSRVHAVLHDADLLRDQEMAVLHVDDTARSDRMELTVYSVEGHELKAFTLYDDDGRGIPRAYAFAIDPRDLDGHLVLEAGAALHDVPEDGWLVDLASVRDHNLVDDRRATQREMTLANLRDLVACGDVSLSLR